MNTKQTIDKLWDEMRDVIDLAYKTSSHKATGDIRSTPLRDYARDMSWADNLAALLGRETANERQHRNNRPAPAGFSINSAAKLILMNCVMRGSDKENLPPSTDFLVYRQSAVEAEVLGFLIKPELPLSWKQELQKLDYVELMKTA